MLHLVVPWVPSTGKLLHNHGQVGEGPFVSSVSGILRLARLPVFRQPTGLLPVNNRQNTVWACGCDDDRQNQDESTGSRLPTMCCLSQPPRVCGTKRWDRPGQDSLFLIHKHRSVPDVSEWAPARRIHKSTV
jgi:hypothetical protein